jgi:enoyl-CoA hydratase
MSDDALHYELDGKVAVLRLDDGKANALGPEPLAALSAALTRAEKEAASVLLIGRPGRFSGGFDLAVMSEGPDAARAMVTAGAELLMQIYLHPQPVTVACTGHAIAMGCLVLLASDLRIGAQGDFKIGLNEVGIGMALPHFALELARDRLSKRHLTQATLHARLYDPEVAVDAGYLDTTCPPDALVATALAEARRLAELNAAAYRLSKTKLRGDLADSIRASLAEDMAHMMGPSTGE